MLILRSFVQTGDLVTSVWMTLFGVGVRLVKLDPFFKTEYLIKNLKTVFLIKKYVVWFQNLIVLIVFWFLHLTQSFTHVLLSHCFKPALKFIPKLH